MWDLAGATKSGAKKKKKCVISYVGNHLKPKKNPVCSGSEHKQRGKVQTRSQRGGAGGDDSRLDKRLVGTVGGQGPDYREGGLSVRRTGENQTHSHVHL